MTVLLALAGSSVAAVAEVAPSDMIPPDRAKDIAAGLVDATGPLALQCAMGKLGDKIRTGATPAAQVASAAVKDSLAFAGANKGCGAATEVLKAVLVIVALTEVNEPVYITLKQSTKNNFWPKPDTCTVVIRAGASEVLSQEFQGQLFC